MKTLTLTLSPEEVNVVLAGLGELPAKHSVSLILKVKEQCDPQMTEQPVTQTQEVLDKDTE